MKKQLWLIPLALLLAISLVAIGCPAEEEPPPPPPPPPTDGEEPPPPPPPPPPKDSIVFGQAVSLSGVNAFIHKSAGQPLQELWVDEINAKGGIYVEEYGKRLPIERIIYDDESDHGTLVRLIEKLILEDEVDFLFPPCSTSYLFAAAPVANKYGYILMGNEGGATSLEKVVPDLPYLFSTLNYSNHYQLPVLADLFVEWGVEKVAITFNEDLHGAEYVGVASTEFPAAGLNIVMMKSHPLGIKDLSLTLKEAQDKGADAFCAFTYPDEVFLLTGQSMELGINFNAFVMGPGACFSAYRDVVFNAEIIDGVIAEGAWSPKQSPGAQEFYDKFVARYTEMALDWWGHIFYWGAYQFLEQAIEMAGTLDQAVIRDIMETQTFETCLGPTWFDDLHRLAKECHPGEIAQWQNGVWEVIGPTDKATAEAWYPKPPWPTP